MGLLRKLAKGVGGALETVGKHGYEDARQENLLRVRQKFAVEEREAGEDFQTGRDAIRRTQKLSDISTTTKQREKEATVAHRRGLEKITERSKTTAERQVLEDKVKSSTTFEVTGEDGLLHKNTRIVYEGGVVEELSGETGDWTTYEKKSPEARHLAAEARLYDSKIDEARKTATKIVKAANDGWGWSDKLDFEELGYRGKDELVETMASFMARGGTRAEAMQFLSGNRPSIDTPGVESTTAPTKAVSSPITADSITKTPTPSRRRTRGSQKQETSAQRQQQKSMRIELQSEAKKAPKGELDFYQRIIDSSDPSMQRYKPDAKRMLMQLKSSVR